MTHKGRTCLIHCLHLFFPVHHEEAAPPPCHQLPGPHPLLPDPRPRLLLHRRPPRREAGLQSHRAARHLRSAAHPERNPALHVQQDSTHRYTLLQRDHDSGGSRSETKHNDGLFFLLSATYCIVIFALMLLSLLETILVTYLMEKSSPYQEKFRLRGDHEDTQEKEKNDNCNKGETHIIDNSTFHRNLSDAPWRQTFSSCWFSFTILKALKRNQWLLSRTSPYLWYFRITRSVTVLILPVHSLS